MGWAWAASAGRAGVCVVRVGLSGLVEVVSRGAVGGATSDLSVMVSRSRNRVVCGTCGRGERSSCRPVTGEVSSCGELEAGYDTDCGL